MSSPFFKKAAQIVSIYVIIRNLMACLIIGAVIMIFAFFTTDDPFSFYATLIAGVGVIAYGFVYVGLRIKKRNEQTKQQPFDSTDGYVTQSYQKGPEGADREILQTQSVKTWVGPVQPSLQFSVNFIAVSKDTNNTNTLILTERSFAALLIGTEDVESTANDIISILPMDSIYKSAAGNMLNPEKIRENIATQIQTNDLMSLVDKYPGFVTDIADIEKTTFNNKTLKVTFKNGTHKSWVSPVMGSDGGLQQFADSLNEVLADASLSNNFSDSSGNQKQ